MKKILTLIITIFLTSGCYDYIELNNLSIISGISIDYQNDKYLVNYEVLNDKKSGSDSSTKGSFTISGNGKTLAEAFYNTAKETPKKPYYAHLKCLIISEEVASNKLENTIDYLLRNTDIRSEFNTVIAKDMSAKDLLNSSNKDTPVVSDLIETLLNTNKYYKNNTATQPFEEMVTDILIFGEEAEMPVITKENDKLNISGIGIFKDYNLQGILTAEESIIYNILTGNALNASFNIPCNNNYLTLGVYNSKPNIEIKDQKINIDISTEAQVIESNCEYNFKDPETYKKLNKDYETILKKKIQNFIDTTLSLDSDILGIRRNYYIKTREKNNDIWKLLDYDIKVDLKINKKGLIFEVKE